MPDKPFVPTVGKCWMIFSDIIPVDAPTKQIVEMRRAFYAGVRIAFEMMETISVNIDSEDRAALELELLKNECDAFAKLVQQGKA